ncbi:hypothetical protein ACWEXK_12120 [Staphylococcus xylosus]|uniref:hypothetical protein n=1 Tax=Staphylococcus xylosus TaxID=1288 RepID=UPI000D1E9D25|nr:hypothetical protein [Staphylococcus xylosus]PTI27889.1 hypothetical protein BU115_03175 [Staphylococcus xylosus]
MSNKFRNKVLSINTYQIELLLLNVVLSGIGVIRAMAWISNDDEHLINASPIYINMSKHVEISSVGWLLLISSLFLFMSEFMKEKASKYMSCISAFISGIIHLMFGMMSVDHASLPTTYYTEMLVGIILLIVAFLGGVDLWRKNLSQHTE